eukprot:GGOE01009573.1.p1 GENE.GGOE01009573.1~~GGOE01009573.1.p1  ORF type:complete len:398 (-),score=123.81 GGOE01009573.1:220-1284(-)
MTPKSLVKQRRMQATGLQPVVDLGDVLHVFQKEDIEAHHVVEFEHEVGVKRLLIPDSLGLVVQTDPPDAEITLFCSDRPPDTPLDYRWSETVPGKGDRLILQFGELCGTMYFGALAKVHLWALRITLVHNIQVLWKDDSLLPWRMAEAYNGTADDEADVKRWIYETSCCLMLDEDGCTPLLRACRCPWKGNLRITKLLLQEYQDAFNINQRDRRGRSALHYLMDIADSLKPDTWPTAYARAYSLAEELLQCPKLDLNAQDKEGNTPAHLAAATDLSESRMLHLLLEAGCNLAIRNQKGLTPEETAAAAGRQHNVTYLALFDSLPPLTGDGTKLTSCTLGPSAAKLLLMEDPCVF